MSREIAQSVLTEWFGPFGPIRFPYVSMGKIDSLDLFGPTELMILALYWRNKGRWKVGLDIGANLGLHTICMSKSGFQMVHAYEPDPINWNQCDINLRANVYDPYKLYQQAVYTKEGTVSFVRVLNNLTGNHIEGYKASYGPRESITVHAVDCRPLWQIADFAKLDCEGVEADLVLTMTPDMFPRFSCVMEVRNVENARQIYEHLKDITPLWSQKVDWKRVERFEDMPMANREGSLFIGERGPW